MEQHQLRYCSKAAKMHLSNRKLLLQIELFVHFYLLQILPAADSKPRVLPSDQLGGRESG